MCSENFAPRAQVQFEMLGLPNGGTRFRRPGLAFKIRVISWRCRRSFLGSSSYAASSHKESQRSTSLASIRSPPYIRVQPGVPIKVAPGFFIFCARKVRPAPRRRKFREAFAKTRIAFEAGKYFDRTSCWPISIWRINTLAIGSAIPDLCASD